MILLLNVVFKPKAGDFEWCCFRPILTLNRKISKKFKWKNYNNRICEMFLCNQLILNWSGATMHVLQKDCVLQSTWSSGESITKQLVWSQGQVSDSHIVAHGSLKWFFIWAIYFEAIPLRLRKKMFSVISGGKKKSLGISMRQCLPWQPEGAGSVPRSTIVNLVA